MRKRPLRGYLKWETEAPRQQKTLKLGEISEILGRHMGFEDRIRTAAAVVLWESVVGEIISAVSEAKKIKDGVLYVKVSDPAWRQELQYTKEDIIFRLNKAIGGKVVSEIKLS